MQHLYLHFIKMRELYLNCIKQNLWQRPSPATLNFSLQGSCRGLDSCWQRRLHSPERGVWKFEFLPATPSTRHRQPLTHVCAHTHTCTSAHTCTVSGAQAPSAEEGRAASPERWVGAGRGPGRPGWGPRSRHPPAATQRGRSPGASVPRSAPSCPMGTLSRSGLYTHEQGHAPGGGWVP